jgi:ABC-type nitrate/sulfonate/bicarbonate transport system ATPase subunit
MELSRVKGKEPHILVQLDSVSKCFSAPVRNLRVLDNISISVWQGEFISIIGPSGCGKSTLLNIIAGLEEPSNGQVKLFNNEPGHRLGQVGYMQQKDLLLPWRTVLNNAILSLEIQGIARSKARLKALDLMDKFGLHGFESHYPSSMSGGMRQRTAFLRTMLADRSLILLDEPFGALDALTRTQMQEWLLNLWDGSGKTIILVTHDVEEALFLSDRVYVLTGRPGRVNMVSESSIPRPRNYKLVTHKSFLTMKLKLMAALQEEHQCTSKELLQE